MILNTGSDKGEIENALDNNCSASGSVVTRLRGLPCGIADPFDFGRRVGGPGDQPANRTAHSIVRKFAWASVSVLTLFSVGRGCQPLVAW